MAWFRRALNVLRPGRVRSDIERELSFHVAERADELREAGVSETEAERTARREFGPYERQVETTRDADVSRWLDAAVRNVRLALRAIARTPGFSATAVLTLALGVGANSAIFSAIDAVLLRPLPFPQADRLVGLSQSLHEGTQPFVAPTRLEDWNRLNDSFQAISGYYVDDGTELSGELPEKLTRVFVAPRFLEVWGVQPALGRDFNADEQRFGGPLAALISDRLWRRKFAADPAVVGRTLRFGTTTWFAADPAAVGRALRVGTTTCTVVGVMPPTFFFPVRDADVWMPSPPDAPYAQDRGATWFTTIGRLEPGVSIDRARANLATVQAALGREYPRTDAGLTPVVEPLKEITVGGVRRSLWILFGSASLLLLIACTNIAALLLSRSASRQHEIAVRFSLGASRTSVAAHLLTEVLVLALAGAGAGLLLAAGAASAFRALAGSLPRVDEMGLDWRIVLYSLGCALVATLACGLVPALRATRRGLAGPLAQSGRSTTGGRHRVQFALVGAQVALAVTLLAGAGLLARSLQELGRVAPGFDPSHVLTFQVTAGWGETANRGRLRERTEAILEAVRSLPGVVETAASSFHLPGARDEYQIEVKPVEGRADSDPRMITQARVVTPTYFATMRIPLLSGETCRDEPGLRTLMVNRRFANAYLDGASAIGRQLIQPGNPAFKPAVIRGIVGDARENGLDQEPPATVYVCNATLQPGTFFLARTRGEPAALAESLRRRLKEVEPGRSVYGLAPLADHISEAYSEEWLRTLLLASFAAAAVSLVCVGLYGTLSYLVAVRQRELALRLALGSLRSGVAREVVSRGLRVTLLGTAAGLLLAAAFARMLSGVLYGVSPSDPWTLGAVAVLPVAIAVVASLVPAIRAARLDPMRVLREE